MLAFLKAALEADKGGLITPHPIKGLTPRNTFNTFIWNNLQTVHSATTLWWPRCPKSDLTTMLKEAFNVSRLEDKVRARLVIKRLSA